jgi:PAS domain S-box-containing protein
MYGDDFGVVHVSMNFNEIGNILGINSGIKRIFGYDSDQVLGQNISILMPEPIKKYHDILLRNLL